MSSPDSFIYLFLLMTYFRHPVGNFKHKNLTVKCDVAGEGIAIKYIHIS